MYDWNDLRLFLAIARRGSALAAAKELNLNQTTVTRRIDALEQALGTSLFLRTARGSVLTAQGQAILPHAEAIERAALGLDGEADRIRRDLGGEIRITAPEAIMAVFIGPMTLRYRGQNPDIRFDYLSAEHLLDLTRGEADVAFRAGMLLDGDTLIGQALPFISWTGYCSRTHAERHGLPDGLSDLAGRPVIGYAGPIANLPHLKDFMCHVASCDVVGTSNNVPNMTGMVRAGLGIGLLPCFVGDLQDDMVRCFPPSAGMGTRWWIAVAPEAWALPRVRRFVNYSAATLRHMRPTLSGEVDQATARALMTEFSGLN